MHVSMILKRSYSELEKDSRVIKEAKTLIEQNHKVTIYIYGCNIKHINALPFSEVKSCIVPNIPFFSKYNPFNVDINNPQPKNKILIISNLLINQLYQIVYFISSLKLILSDNTDVFHAHDYETLLLSFVAAKIKNAKLIYDSHELWTESRYFISTKGKIKKPIVSSIEHILIKRTDKVITVNNSIANYLSLKYSIDKPVVVSNYPETQCIEKNNMLREKLNLDNNCAIVLYQGALFKGRGLEQLIECSQHLKDSIFVIMGDGYLKNDLCKKIKSNKIDNVHLLDAVDPTILLEYVASADIGIAPIQNICLSYYLSLPNKIGEFIMAGIPFAASDFPEMETLAIHENMGEVFSPDNLQSMIKAIKNLRDETIYQEKKQNVLKNKSRYSWENESLELKKIYSAMENNISL